MASKTPAGPVPDYPPTGIQPGALYRTPDAAKLTGLSRKTLEAWRGSGTGPAFCKLGRTVAYRGEDLLAFIAAGRRTATTEG